MSIRRRIVFRLHRCLLYWGLLDHPHGRHYVKDHYTPLGGNAERGD